MGLSALADFRARPKGKKELGREAGWFPSGLSGPIPKYGGIGLPMHPTSLKRCAVQDASHGQKAVFTNGAWTMNGHTVGHRCPGSDGHCGAPVAVDDNPVLDVDLFADDNRRHHAVGAALIGPDNGERSDKHVFSIVTLPMIWADGSMRADGWIWGQSPTRLGRILLNLDIIPSLLFPFPS